jgi:hypothetical protein
MVRILIVLSFLILCKGVAQGQQLIVPTGTGTTINTSVTYSSVSVGGPLTVSSGVTLTITGDINFDAVNGGSIIMQTGSTINAGGNLSSGSYASNSVNGSVTIASGAVFQIGESVTAGNGTSITITGGSLICSQNIILGSSGSSNTNPAVINASAKSSITCSAFFPVANANAGLSLVNSTMVVSGSSALSGTITINGGRLTFGQNVSTNSGAPCAFIMSNSGKVQVAGDFSNGVPTSVLFPSGSNPIIELNGTGTQHVYNNDSGNNLSIYNLICSGTGTKMLYCNLSISDSLILGNTQLQLQNAILAVTSTDPGAITRGSGFVSVAYKEQGLFIRNTAQVADYLFPVGGTNVSGTVLYRPVLITPSTAAAGSYSVNFETGSPDTHSISQTGSSIKALNANYYHKIDSELTGSPAVTISISFVPGTDGSYASVAQWSNAANAWQALSNPTSVSTINGLLYVRVAQYSGFLQDDFILASGGAGTAGSNASYAVLKKQLDGSCYITNDQVLFFKFKEEYTIQANTKLSYTVYGRDRSTPVTALQPMYVNYGDNRFQLDASSLVSGNVYTLEVLNSKNEKWLLRFKVD